MNKTEIRGLLLERYDNYLRADTGADDFHRGELAAIRKLAVDLGYEPQIVQVEKQWQAEREAALQPA